MSRELIGAVKSLLFMRNRKNEIVTAACAALIALAAQSSSARADAITDWNGHWEEAVFATGQAVPAQARFGAILHAAMFDAVNGITRKYTPYRVAEPAPPGAREEAAAAQAAYTVLAALYPSEVEKLSNHLADSLKKIPGHQGKSVSISRGRAWGEHVANQILTWRAGDGWTAAVPAYYGGSAAGMWRSIPVPGSPDGTLPAVVPQLAILEPFTMTSPGQFRPGPPYGGATLMEAMATAAYAADLNEVKAIGRVDSATRTEDQTHLARLWQAMGPIDLNRAARAVVSGRNSLVENARIFALANMASCDALITSMESKFVYELWRPHHAVRLAETDGNAVTEPDTEWSGLIVAPRFPEYISNHSSLTAAYMHVMARLIGDNHEFELSSPNYPGFAWQYRSFSEAADQVKEARIWAGIHFRTACEIGQETGQTVAEHALNGVMREARGRH